MKKVHILQSLKKKQIIHKLPILNWVDRDEVFVEEEESGVEEEESGCRFTKLS